MTPEYVLDYESPPVRVRQPRSAPLVIGETLIAVFFVVQCLLLWPWGLSRGTTFGLAEGLCLVQMMLAAMVAGRSFRRDAPDSGATESAFFALMAIVASVLLPAMLQ